MTVRYKLPREVIGKWLAFNGSSDSRPSTTDTAWDWYYNEEQKEFWYKKADALIKLVKKKGLL